VYLLKHDGVRQFEAARKLFEAAIAREVARSADAADVARMEASLAANHAARGDAKAFEATDVTFYREIARAAGNPLLGPARRPSVLRPAYPPHGRGGVWLRTRRLYAGHARREDAGSA
jgi:DNA-binding GntR family transcriptional regulator